METNENLSISKIKLASISKIRGKIENFKRSYELLKKDHQLNLKIYILALIFIVQLEISMDSLECREANPKNMC